MLSTAQVENFFVEVLKFPNWEHVKSNDIMEFLKQILQRYQYHCYFHNTEMAATPPDQRRPPKEEDAIRIGLGGTGGVCIHQNAFLTLILKSVGLNAFMTAGNCVGSESEGEGNHCMCIVQLTPDEIYALDVGAGQPLDDPIPLHNLPFSGIGAGFRYEYRFNETTKRYEKWQLDGTFFRGKFDDPTTTQLRYTFTLIPKNFDYFSTTLVDIFTNPETSIFLKSPFLFRCLDWESDVIGENGRRYILIFGASSVIYDNVSREMTNFTGYKELKPHILEHFPKIDPKLLDKALDYFCSISTELILGRGCE